MYPVWFCRLWFQCYSPLIFTLNWYERQRQNTSDLCAQRRLKSDCACAQSDQSLRCPHIYFFFFILILGYPKWAQWRFWSDCANAQADLNLRWAHKSKGTLADIAAFLFTSAVWTVPSMNCSQYELFPVWTVPRICTLFISSRVWTSKLYLHRQNGQQSETWNTE